MELGRQESDVMNVSSIVLVLLQFVQHQFGQLHVLMDDANRTAREQTLDGWLRQADTKEYGIQSLYQFRPQKKTFFMPSAHH